MGKRLVIVTHERCWYPLGQSPIAYGGFPFQMQAITELFDQRSCSRHAGARQPGLERFDCKAGT